MASRDVQQQGSQQANQRYHQEQSTNISGGGLIRCGIKPRERQRGMSYLNQGEVQKIHSKPHLPTLD